MKAEMPATIRIMRKGIGELSHLGQSFMLLAVGLGASKVAQYSRVSAGKHYIRQDGVGGVH
jgi:hypothetical protein